MLELLIVRHGQSEGDLENRHEGRADYELTALGKEQARHCADWLHTHFPPEEILSSPLKRARFTAEIIGTTCGVEVSLDEALMEWDNGLLAGMDKTHAMEKFPLPKEGRRPHDTFAETESYIQFRARAECFLSKLLANYETKERRLCLVSHGGFITMFFRSLLRLPLDTALSLHTNDTGIHLFRVEKDKRSIVFANYQEHLCNRT